MSLREAQRGSLQASMRPLDQAGGRSLAVRDGRARAVEGAALRSAAHGRPTCCRRWCARRIRCVQKWCRTGPQRVPCRAKPVPNPRYVSPLLPLGALWGAKLPAYRGNRPWRDDAVWITKAHIGKWSPLKIRSRSRGVGVRFPPSAPPFWLHRRDLQDLLGRAGFGRPGHFWRLPPTIADMEGRFVGPSGKKAATFV
jgi:hypothetical protein